MPYIYSVLRVGLPVLALLQFSSSCFREIYDGKYDGGIKVFKVKINFSFIDFFNNLLTSTQFSIGVVSLM